MNWDISISKAQIFRGCCWLIGISLFLMTITNPEQEITNNFWVSIPYMLFWIGLGVGLDTIYTAIFMEEEKEKNKK